MPLPSFLRCLICGTSTPVQKVPPWSREEIQAAKANPLTRPFFTLKYVLQHSKASLAFIQFLRKEHSSENALFWQEIRLFSKMSRRLELACPNWPRSYDDVPSILNLQKGTKRYILQQKEKDDKEKEAKLKSSLVVSNGKSPNKEQLVITNVHSPSAADEGPLEDEADDSAEEDEASGDVEELAADHDAKSDPSNKYLMPAPTVAFAPSPPRNNGAATTGANNNANANNNGNAPFLISPISSRYVKGAISPLSNQVSPSSMSNNCSPKFNQLTSTPSPKRAHKLLRLLDSETVAQLREQAQETKAWAERIYSQYIHESAPFQLNLPDEVTHFLKSQIELIFAYHPCPLTPATDEPNSVATTVHTSTSHHKPGHETFEVLSLPSPPPFPLSQLYKAAEVAVFQLMSGDSFRRFLSTPEFREMIEQVLAEAEMAHEPSLSQHSTSSKHQRNKRTVQVQKKPDASAALNRAPSALTIKTDTDDVQALNPNDTIISPVAVKPRQNTFANATPAQPHSSRSSAAVVPSNEPADSLAAAATTAATATAASSEVAASVAPVSLLSAASVDSNELLASDLPSPVHSTPPRPSLLHAHTLTPMDTRHHASSARAELTRAISEGAARQRDDASRDTSGKKLTESKSRMKNDLDINTLNSPDVND